jgi:hypothetical protein
MKSTGAALDPYGSLGNIWELLCCLIWYYVTQLVTIPLESSSSDLALGSPRAYRRVWQWYCGDVDLDAGQIESYGHVMMNRTLKMLGAPCR